MVAAMETTKAAAPMEMPAMMPGVRRRCSAGSDSSFGTTTVVGAGAAGASLVRVLFVRVVDSAITYRWPGNPPSTQSSSLSGLIAPPSGPGGRVSSYSSLQLPGSQRRMFPRTSSPKDWTMKYARSVGE